MDPAAEPGHEIDCRPRRAAGREQVVHDQHALSFRDRIVVHLDKKYYPGGRFVIESRNHSPENVYIQSATLNGEPLSRPWIYHSDAINGAELVLTMGSEPNKNWGSAPEAAPPQNQPQPRNSGNGGNGSNGGGNSGGGNTGTPVGTSSVSVSASAGGGGGSNHAATLTIVITH